jgi:hypothetical protein
LTRRRLLLALIALATCLASFGLPDAADAQPPASPRRIGVLRGAYSPESQGAQHFRQGLPDAGYSEGRDVVIVAVKAYVEAEKCFRRIQGYRDMYVLSIALNRARSPRKGHLNTKGAQSMRAVPPLLTHNCLRDVPPDVDPE